MKYMYMTLCLLACLSALAYNDHRNARVDSLEAALKSSNPPKGEQLLRAYDELMRGYLPYDSAKASVYGRKALALSYELNGLNVRQNVIRHFAQMHYAREEYDEAAALYQQALAIVDTMATLKRYTEKDIDDARSTIYGNMGNLYNIQDKANLAIHYYQLALPIFEKYDWKESQVILYYNIGELYGQMDNLDEAERNYQKAIEKGKASGDSLMMAIPKKGLVGVYFNRGEHDKALRTVNEVLAYYKVHREEEPVDYASMLAFKARILLMEGHTDVAAAKTCVAEALPYIDKSEMMFDDTGTIYMAACEVAMAEKQWQKALDYGLKSVHPDSTATVADKGGYMLLAEIYTELGDKEKAREYMTKTYDMMSRYATDHYQSGLSQMEVLYETEKKEAAIRQLTREKQWLVWGSVLALLVLLLVVLLFVVWGRSKQLSRKHELVTAKLEGELAERVRLSRDLHDRLGGLLTALKLSLQEGSPALQLTDEAITEMRNVSHHLLPDSLRRNGLRTALRDYCQTLKAVSFSFVGDEQYIQHAETIYCLVYELVNNAIKSAQAQHIRVQLIAEKDYTAVNVSDDGKGIKSEKVIVKSEKFATAQDGMGLQNIRERVEALHGTLDVNSKPGEGTEINIELKNDD